MIGYAICGSFCTHAESLEAMKKLIESGYDIQPIMSETVFSTDTRFGTADTFKANVTKLTSREIIHTIKDAEPLGPARPLDALIISPCTGNTLAKLACGITDSAVCMAAKAHLRSNLPLLIALASNDAMSVNLTNIAELMRRKNIYFVPMRQDDPKAKPHSLVADFSLISVSLDAMMRSIQLRPVFL